MNSQYNIAFSKKNPNTTVGNTHLAVGADSITHTVYVAN